MITRSITFDDEVYDTIVDEAGKRGVSANWLINKILAENIERGLAPLDRLRVTQ